MVYITVKQAPRYHQMTLEEFLFGDPQPQLISSCQSCTRTYAVQKPSKSVMSKYNITSLIQKLEDFNVITSGIRTMDKHALYRSFQIKKRNGKYRQIDAPNDLLMGFQRVLKSILEDDFGALYHTSAFAYIRHRCTLDSIKRHQRNESRWYAKYDFSNFFGSTTKEFVMDMLSVIFPFSEVIATDRGRNALSNAIDIAFLDGVLPQGTPVSPLITNIMMIPIDFELCNKFREFNKQRFVYTRYADDILVSSKFDFSPKEIEREINSVLDKYKAPFKINAEKTRYGSSSGRNWNLGVMLNKDNKITVGARNKRVFASMVHNYVLDTLNGKRWDRSAVMSLEGRRNYYYMVEGDVITEMVNKIGKKYGVDVLRMIKNDLR